MSVVVSHQSIGFVAKAVDKKAAILKEVGNISGIDVMYNMVLLATYIGSDKVGKKQLIIRPDLNIAEDVWQGKVGLVVKLGPNAFQDDADFSFYGQKAEVGEWCVYKVGDAWSLNINGYPCRLVRDSSIRLKVADPNIVF